MTKAVVTFQYEGPEARLDRVVVDTLSGELHCSRAQVERWIEEGRVTVDGALVIKPSRKVGAGARIEVTPAEERTTTMAALDLPLEIITVDEGGGMFPVMLDPNIQSLLDGTCAFGSLAEAVAYTAPQAPAPLPDAYVQQGAALCNQQVALGGYRLATLLEYIFTAGAWADL
jgi:ribosomal 50S subunit-recycling heat shock protein